jgi:surface glycoprotein (TIGR04207 family)/PGF-CTERM protein
MTSTNDKVRSLILAALMVMSVFAGTVAFTGSAAAAGNVTDISGPTNAEPDEGTTVTHELNYTVTDLSDDGNSDTFTITIPSNGAEFANADDLYLYVEDANGDVIAGTGGNNDADFGSSPSIQGANSGTNNQVTFDIGPDSSFDTSEVTVNARFDIAWPSVEGDTSGDVTIAVEDSNGDDASVTAEDAVTIQETDSSGEGTSLSSGTIVFAGEDAFYDASEDVPLSDGSLRLVSDPGTDDAGTVRTLNINDNNIIQIDSSDLETNDYAIVDGSGDGSADQASTLVQFEVIVQTLNTEFSDDEVDDDENETLEVSSNRAESFNVTVEADGVSNDDLESAFVGAEAFENEDDEIEFATTDGDEIDVEFDENINRGDYEFNFTTVDTEVESSAAITVTRGEGAELGLNESSVTVETGDTSNITVTFQDTETGTLQIGGEDIGYQTSWNVTDGDDDGIANFSFNTYDTANDGDDYGLSVPDGEDADFSLNDTRNGGVAGALDAGNYEIEVANSAEDIGNGPDAVGTLAITERSTTSAQPWVTFSDAAGDIESGDDVIAAIEAGDVTQRRDVAEGDLAVIQFQVSGIFGYLENNEDDLAGAFGAVDDEEEDLPVSLQVEQSNPDPNTEPKTVNLDDSNVQYVLDDERNMLFVVVDTDASASREGGDDDLSIEDGDRYNATLEVNALDDDSVTLNDAKRDERVSTNFRVTEREAPLNTNADDNVEIAQSEDGEVTGTTTIAPGSEITVRVRSVSGAENPFVMSETVNVSTDGTYNATFDFADTPVGTNFTATVSAAPGLDGTTEFDGIVVEQVDTETPTPTPTPEPTDTDTPTPTPEPTDTDTPEPTDTDTPEPTEETTTTTPGFGAVVAVLALLGAALLALRRD